MKQYPFIFSNVRKYRLQRHISFWIFWWIFFAILYSYASEIRLLPDLRRLGVSLVDSAFFMIPHMFLSYGLMYFVIPRYVVKARYLEAALAVLLFFFVTANISVLIGKYVLSSVRHCLFPGFNVGRFNDTFLFFLLAGLRGAITVGGIAAAIKLMKYWFAKQQHSLRLEKENAEAGLQLLKAQIHPHFLFNTLNNIYAYTQSTSPIASKMVSSLSELLRYTLHEGNQMMVPLERELQMIQEYIGLEKMRYGNHLELHLQLPEKSNSLCIAPLLLLPLVENCFKHGTSDVLEQPWIHFSVSVVGKQMQMKLLNSKRPGMAKSESAGIGLKNVQERLLLLYPGRHELTITNEEEIFIVNLRLDLEPLKERGRVQINANVTEYV